MVTVTIERDGYKVEGVVGAIDTGPGIDPGLEVKEILQSWINDPDAFREAHGNATLEFVVKDEADEIDDDLIDAAMIEVHTP